MAMKMHSPLFTDYNDPISKAVHLIKKKKLPVVVLKDGKYHGLLDARQVREHRMPDFSAEPCGGIAVMAPRLKDSMDLLKLAESFFITRFTALAVVDDDDNVQGVMTRLDVLSLLKDEGVIPDKKVSEVMSSPVVTIKKGTTVGKAIGIMRENGVRRVAVVDENGRMLGIISTFDIGVVLSQPVERLPFVREQHKTEGILVDSVMTTDLRSISPSENLRGAVDAMVKNDTQSLVVLSGGKPVGLLSSRDVLEPVLTAKKFPSIFLSGLDRYDKPYYQDIVSMCSLAIKKMNKSKQLSIDYVSLHVKKAGHRYSIFARVSIDQNIISVNKQSYGWDLMEAIGTTMDEIEKIVKKKRSEVIDTKKKPRIKMGEEE